MFSQHSRFAIGLALTSYFRFFFRRLYQSSQYFCSAFTDSIAAMLSEFTRRLPGWRFAACAYTIRRQWATGFRQLGNGQMCGIDQQKSIVLIYSRFIWLNPIFPPSVWSMRNLPDTQMCKATGLEQVNSDRRSSTISGNLEIFEISQIALEQIHTSGTYLYNVYCAIYSF